MAVKWSWAFGAETALQLNDEMGWQMADTNPLSMTPSQTFIYSYPGSPTTGPSARYSMRTDFDKNMRPPVSAWSNEGWVAIPLLGNTTVYSNYGRVIEIYGSDSNDSIWFQFEPSGLVNLYIDSTIVDSVTPSALSFDWNYWALRYTMSGSTWGATLFLNGVEILSGSKTGGGVQPEPGPNGVIQFQSPYNAGDATYFGQIICYDSLSDIGAAVPFQYVTRVNPSVDTAETGSWTPVGGSTNFEVLSGSYDSSTHTVNTGSSTGDKVICKVTGALGLITQLGTTPTSISGITVHAWASGSGQNGFTALSDDNATYDNGTEITPDLNDPTYCFSTAVDQPSNGAVWNATSSLYIKYEVS